MTDRRVFVRSKDRWPSSRGEWSPVTIDGVLTARLCCPDCGDTASIANHTIDDAGNVAPSLMCNGCSYHESGVRLLDWLQEKRS